MIASLKQRFFAMIDAEGDTMSLGLMRVALGLLVWARFADDMLPFRHATPIWFVTAALFFPLSLAFVVGWRTRITAPLFALTLLFMVQHLGWSEFEPWTHHHVYALLYGVVLLAFTPCGTSLSLDRLRALRQAEATGQPPPPERGPLWAVPLIGLHVSILYAFSAGDKCTTAFLSGQRLTQIWMYLYAGSDHPQGALAATLAALAAVSVILLEAGLAITLWLPATRRASLWLGVALHLGFYVAMPVGTFSLTMVALYLAFIPGEQARAALARLTRP